MFNCVPARRSMWNKLEHPMTYKRHHAPDLHFTSIFVHFQLISRVIFTVAHSVLNGLIRKSRGAWQNNKSDDHQHHTLDVTWQRSSSCTSTRNTFTFPTAILTQFKAFQKRLKWKFFKKFIHKVPLANTSHDEQTHEKSYYEQKWVLWWVEWMYETAIVYLIFIGGKIYDLVHEAYF